MSHVLTDIILVMDHSCPYKNNDVLGFGQNKGSCSGSGYMAVYIHGLASVVIELLACKWAKWTDVSPQLLPVMSDPSDQSHVRTSMPSSGKPLPKHTHTHTHTWLVGSMCILVIGMLSMPQRKPVPDLQVTHSIFCTLARITCRRTQAHMQTGTHAHRHMCTQAHVHTGIPCRTGHFV